MFSQTWNDKGSAVPSGQDIRRIWTDWALKLAEPFQSAYLALPSNVTLWCDRLAEWRTIPWDNCKGRVTLAGDAAHPMTYRKSALLKVLLASLNDACIVDRGQGLNNAIHDAAYLCNALNEHCHRGTPLPEAMDIYEKEMQERGRAAVISSGENSLMVHDWEQLQNSPFFKIGLKALEKK